MAWFRRLQREPFERATDAQIGYIQSLMWELDVDTVDAKIIDRRTGAESRRTLSRGYDDGIVRDPGRLELGFDDWLSKGAASQVITGLLAEKERRENDS